MAGKGGDNSNKLEGYMVLAVIVVAVLGGCIFFYNFHRYAVNLVLLKGIVWALAELTRLPHWLQSTLQYPDTGFVMSGHVVPLKKAIYYLAYTNPGRMPAHTVLQGLALVSRFLRWPVVLAVGGACVYGYLRPPLKSRYQRVFTLARELMDEHVQFNPRLAPVVGRRLDKEPMDKGPWRKRLDPITLAVEHRLLKIVDANGKLRGSMKKVPPSLPKAKMWQAHYRELTQFDLAAARAVFREQLGPRLPTREKEVEITSRRGKKRRVIKTRLLFDELCDYEKALATAFACVYANDFDQANQLLDQYARSFKELSRSARNSRLDKPGERLYSIDTRGVDELWSRYKRHVPVRSAWVWPWLADLLSEVEKRFDIAPVDFLWLRPVNPNLWCALNQVGGFAPWCEAAAVFAHGQAEREMGRPLAEPLIEPAVEGLKQGLEDEGWLPLPTARQES